MTGIPVRLLSTTASHDTGRRRIYTRTGGSFRSGAGHHGNQQFFRRTAALEGGEFLSDKRDGVGTGIASVIAIAEKYGGEARFTVEGGVFKASVWLYGLKSAGE